MTSESVNPRLAADFQNHNDRYNVARYLVDIAQDIRENHEDEQLVKVFDCLHILSAFLQLGEMDKVIEVLEPIVREQLAKKN